MNSDRQLGKWNLDWKRQYPFQNSCLEYATKGDVNLNIVRREKKYLELNGLAFRSSQGALLFLTLGKASLFS